MTSNFKGFAAVGLALAGLLTVPHAAEAKTWRQWANQYGGGYYVDKYADKYVSEDKNGKVRYKGSKHDKYSGEYYNTKTGKWTGKQYDGKYGGPASTEYTGKSKSSKTGTSATAKNAGSSDTETVISKPAKVKKATVKEADVTASDALESGQVKPVTKKFKPQARLDQGEVYGPPMPPEFETATVEE